MAGCSQELKEERGYVAAGDCVWCECKKLCEAGYVRAQGEINENDAGIFVSSGSRYIGMK